ncbi:MAG: hypothetical protein GF311_18610 [Candidatus Lokiarchaeota archaeon]|nr:hypothetical protein [Candidatus Lokiarchaeota archaeon]
MENLIYFNASMVCILSANNNTACLRLLKFQLRDSIPREPLSNFSHPQYFVRYELLIFEENYYTRYNHSN